MKRFFGISLLAMVAVPLHVAGQQAAAPQSLEQRVQLLERRVRTLSELVLRLDRLQQEVQQLRGEIEVQDHAVDALKKRQRDLYQDVDRRLSQISATGTATPVTWQETAENPPEPVVGSPADISTAAAPVRQSTTASPAEEKAYQQAFEMLTQQRSYAEARKAFKSFLARYPDGQLADNAQYWLGEASYVTRDFDAALTDFSTVLARYPQSSKVPSAMLKIGYIEFEKQQYAKSRQTLDKLINDYPGTSESRLASEFIRKKGL